MTRRRPTDPDAPAGLCPECERTVPAGTPVEACEGCAEDRRRAERERDKRAALARLGTAPLTRARNLAGWALVAAVESLGHALRYADHDVDYEALRRALVHADRARRELEAGRRTW